MRLTPVFAFLAAAACTSPAIAQSPPAAAADRGDFGRSAFGRPVRAVPPPLHLRARPAARGRGVPPVPISLTPRPRPAPATRRSSPARGPARNGIIANTWFDPGLARADKAVYCAEDERDPASSANNPVVSAFHLKVPTLGDRLKAANPAARNVAVSAKDRSAVMMGGHAIDAAYWWKGSGFASFAGPGAVAGGAGRQCRRGRSGRQRRAGHAPAPPLRRARHGSAGGHRLGRDRPVRCSSRARQTSSALSPRLDGAVVDSRSDWSMNSGSALTASPMCSRSGFRRPITSATRSAARARRCASSSARSTPRSAGCSPRSTSAGSIIVAVLTADHGGLDAVERLDRQAWPQAERIADGDDAEQRSPPK